MAPSLVDTLAQLLPAGSKSFQDALYARFLSSAGSERLAFAKLLIELSGSAPCEDTDTERLEAIGGYLNELILEPTSADEIVVEKYIAIAEIITSNAILFNRTVESFRESLVSFLTVCRALQQSQTLAVQAIDTTSILEKHLPDTLSRQLARGPALDLASDQLATLERKLALYLVFVRYLLIDGAVQLQEQQVEDIQVMLYAIVANKNKSISETALKVFGVLVPFMPKAQGTAELLFEIISSLYSEPSLSEAASSIWVVWVDQSEPIRPIKFLISSQLYWEMLQNGLRRGQSLQRKNCLYIISKTISSIDFNIDCGAFCWRQDESARFLATWEKYLTFIEIVSLDGSGNQFYDAVPELQRLLSPPHNIIPSTWIGILFSLAINTTSTGISKISYELILSLPYESLVPWIHETDFFLGDFLPFMSSPQRFSVRAADSQNCLHGNDLARLLARLVASGNSKVARLTLSFIESKNEGLFAGARAFLLKGLADGLGQADVLDCQDIALIVKCAEVRRIGKMRADLCTLLYLKIMRGVRIHNGTSTGPGNVATYISGLSAIIGQSMHLLGKEEAVELAKRASSNPWIGPSAQESLVDNAKLIGDLISSRSFDSASMLFALLIAGPKFSSSLPTDEMRFEVEARAVLAVLSSGDSLKTFLLSQPSMLSLVTKVVSTGTDMLCRMDSAFLQQIRIVPEILDRLSSSHSEVVRAASETSALSSIERLEAFNPVCKIISDLQKSGETGDQSLLQHTSFLMKALCSRERLFKSLDKSLDKSHSSLSLQNVLDISKGLASNSIYTDIKDVHSKGLRAELSATVFNLSKLAVEGNLANSTECNKLFFTVIREHRKHLGEGVIEVLETIQTIFSNSDIQSYAKDYTELLGDIWEFAGDMRRAAEPKRVYIKIMDLAFHPNILRLAPVDESMRQFPIKLARDALVIGKGRRSIVPGLAVALRDSFDSSPDIFSTHGDIGDLLVTLLGFEVTGTVEFHIEKPLSEMFSDYKPNEGKKYREYHDYYEIEIYSSMFDILLKLEKSSESQKKLALSVRMKILTVWAKSIQSKSWDKEKRTPHLQALLALERFLETDNSALRYMETILKFISKEGHPRYRFLLEWALALAIIRQPEFIETIWTNVEAEMTNKKANPKFHSSLIDILLMVGPHIEASRREAFYSKFVDTIVPLVSHAKVAVRHSAITATLKIWEEVKQSGYSSLTNNSLLQSIRQTILQSTYFRELRTEDNMEATEFCPIRNLTLEGVFAGKYLQGVDSVEPIPPNLFRQSAEGNLAFPRGTPESVQKLKVSFTKSEEAAAEAVRIAIEKEAMVLQTKTRSVESVPEKREAVKSSLQLVANHVTSMPNLGGLCRVSEIFGVEKLYLADARVSSHPAFTAVSVSSENWLDMESLSTERDDLKVFFDEKRKQGYTIVGIEQTDSSKVLGEYQFPQRTVLVLGSEKEGIPAEVLALMDTCVIIRQFGETRSLNVQVAAGIVMAEFNRQLRN